MRNPHSFQNILKKLYLYVWYFLLFLKILHLLKRQVILSFMNTQFILFFQNLLERKYEKQLTFIQHFKLVPSCILMLASQCSGELPCSNCSLLFLKKNSCSLKEQLVVPERNNWQFLKGTIGSSFQSWQFLLLLL